MAEIKTTVIDDETLQTQAAGEIGFKKLVTFFLSKKISDEEKFDMLQDLLALADDTGILGLLETKAQAKQ